MKNCFGKSTKKMRMEGKEKKADKQLNSESELWIMLLEKIQVMMK